MIIHLCTLKFHINVLIKMFGNKDDDVIINFCNWELYIFLPPINHMDSQSEHSENDQQFDFVPLHDRYAKSLNLDNEAQIQIQNITKNSLRKAILNSHIDPRNEARISSLQSKTQSINFMHFMTKKKNQHKKKQAFKIMRQMLQQKGYQNISTIADRQHRSVMVVRFVCKIENQPNVMEIEDEVSKEREKIVIRQGIVYVGLICAIEAVYENQMYKLERVVDLCGEDERREQLRGHQQVVIKHPALGYRILMLKGPFWKNDSRNDFGLQLVVDQLQTLRSRQNMRIDMLVIMGPIISQHNDLVKQFTLERTYQQQVENIIDTLRMKVKEILPDIQMLVIPSTDDVITPYPMPQPPFDFKHKKQVRFVSNPCTVRLVGGGNQCKVNFINYDLIHYIDQSKCGRAIKQPLVENIQTYLKQPFFITNTLDDATFDQTNFSGVFNRGEFGNVIVMSSQRSPVFAHKVKGNKLFINIGSLGVDYHAQEKHFMALMSVYEGQGDVTERIKVESIIM